MEKNRKIAILSFLFVLSVFTILLAIGGDYPVTFYWGIPVGLIFGFGTCVYLADVWDPRLLKSSTREASLKKKCGLFLSGCLQQICLLIFSMRTLNGFSWGQLLPGYISR